MIKINIENNVYSYTEQSNKSQQLGSCGFCPVVTSKLCENFEDRGTPQTHRCTISLNLLITNIH